MAKMTKTQMRRAYLAIKQKSSRVWWGGEFSWNAPNAKYAMSTTDLVAIEKICDKYLKKF